MPDSKDKPPCTDLPRWRLDDLFPGPESPDLAAALTAAASGAKALADRYAGRLGGLSAAGLASAIGALQAVEEGLGRISAYADLTFAGDVSDAATGRLVQRLREQVSDIAAGLVFFRLEINRLDDAVFTRMVADPALARWRPWLDQVRTFRPHSLADDLERLLHDKQVTGSSAWARLFDETMADMRVVVDGESLPETEVLERLSDTAPERRQAAGQAFAGALRERRRLFALITNTLAKDKAIEDGWRHYGRPVSPRNLANQVEDPVVDALVSAVTGSYEALSHRYYRLKATLFGVDRLAWWDRNAPLPGGERQIPWPEARRFVLEAYGAFAPELADIAGRFFDGGWIDAQVRAGKAGGAFAHPTVPAVHPYVLLSYQGKPRSLMTLAHELGHGCHQVLAAGQGYFLSQTPLTLAETASVFGEMLVFRRLLAAEDDPARRRVLLAGKIEDMLNTVVRQIAFHQFETGLHERRRSGELTADDIDALWMETQSESLGPAIRLDDDYRTMWAYIPHFLHTPFYVYAYAFGDCLVNALYQRYQDAPDGFAAKYLDLLRAGGSMRHG
ncbi:MAG: M3 family oligoendopeptidase, partial [Alphaproteobacteria bacterium]